MQSLSQMTMNKPRVSMWIAFVVSIISILAVVVPSLMPERVSFLPPLQIDTDPENMLSESEPVRIFHNARKGEYALYDMIVVGVENSTNPQGVFNKESLNRIYDLSQYIETIQFAGKTTNGKPVGVIAHEMMAPDKVDVTEQAGLGSVRFSWLMSGKINTEAEALALREKAMRLPFLKDTLISGDGKALALYVPITSKDISYKVSSQIKAKIAELGGAETYYITGLPVAQDTFGIEMFKQMAISAPMAMALIFALMWYFFRNVRLIVAPMIVAMVSVILTMAALIASGHTVHIMSSMIPIFIMPIAVLDAVHILSDFFDVYPKFKNKRKALTHVMEELSKPMLFTSLTTTAGFASLAFTPIPPVQVFGMFIALGVVLAWVLTVTLVPAYIMLMSDQSLENFGYSHAGAEKVEDKSLLSRLLARTGGWTYAHPIKIVMLTLGLIVVAVFGILKIQINDNPVKWFNVSHDIRIADKAMNARFAGTYMAYLELSAKEELNPMQPFTKALEKVNTPESMQLLPQLKTLENMKAVRDYIYDQQDSAADDEAYSAWETLLTLAETQAAQAQLFTRPDMLAFVEGLQAHLLSTGLVGKINSLPDMVKTVHRDLMLGEESAYTVPQTQNGVAQTLLTFQSSHRPNDLWHFTTPSFDKTVLWLQLKSGDNKDMSKVVAAVDDYMAKSGSASPVALNHNWFGLTYINVVWQQKMVAGMMEAFLGSFAIVLFMMIVLFRSVLWGVLSMIPLSVTIAFIYGVIGHIGKDYDMPVAVLSSLSLGLAVDYAIHFLARSRTAVEKTGSWVDAEKAMFGEPARAIARNVIVIGVGFTPLLFAPLVPYNTVGFFISAILVFAGVASLLILPSLLTLGQKWLFKKGACGQKSCCGHCHK